MLLVRAPSRVCGVSANEYRCGHGAQINFGDLTPYLTYGSEALRGNLENTLSILFSGTENSRFK